MGWKVPLLLTFWVWQNTLPTGRNIFRGFPALPGTTKDFTRLSLSLAGLTLPTVPPSTFSNLFFHHSTHTPHMLCSNLFLGVVTLSPPGSLTKISTGSQPQVLPLHINVAITNLFSTTSWAPGRMLSRVFSRLSSTRRLEGLKAVVVVLMFSFVFAFCCFSTTCWRDTTLGVWDLISAYDSLSHPIP